MDFNFGYSQYNLIALIILSVIFLNMKSDTKIMRYDKKLFLILMVSTAASIILDIFMAAINGKTGYLLRETHVLLTTSYFIVSAIPYLAWSVYVDYYIHKNVKKTRKRIWFIATPAIVSVLLILFSLYNQGVFFISESNIYHRGHLFLLNAALYYSYCVGTYIQIIVEGEYLRKKDYYALLTFGIVPAIVGVLQTIDTSKAYLWLGISISALIIYLNIQNSEINEDYLTGLYNRRQLDTHLINSIRQLNKDELLLMIMIDINHFKKN